MSDHAENTAQAPAVSTRPRPTTTRVVFLLALSAASGAASLVYQIVWMRRLALVFGSTTLATSTVLVAFLGGLAVGAWLWGKFADRSPDRALVAFGIVEAGIAGYALLSGFMFAAMEKVYLGLYPWLDGRPVGFLLLQFALSVIVVGLPAMLMGASLPLLSRHIVADAGESPRQVGALYGCNTVGAALGAATATFGLLPAVGLSTSVQFAALLNAGIAGLALLVGARAGPIGASDRVPVDRVTEPVAAAPTRRVVPTLLVLLGFALSGFAAMAYEVSWTRLLAMVMGSSVYAYGSLVVVLLLGLGLGSALYGRLRLDMPGHRFAFGCIESLLGFVAVASLFVIPHLPASFIRFFPALRDSFAMSIAAQIGMSSLVAFIPALLMGASFPAVVGCLGGRLKHLGRTIGIAYSANTAGTVLGAFLAGFVLIPSAGLRTTIVTGVAANLLAGLCVLASGVRPWNRRLVLLIPATAALALVLALPRWPREALTAGGSFYHRTASDLATAATDMRLLYYRDGINTTISVDESAGTLVYRSNGKPDASTAKLDAANQLLLGHLPMLLHTNPQHVFVLGLGTGMTTAAVARHPVQRIDLVEMEPAAFQAARLFASYNHAVLDDPRLHLVLADGRVRLRATKEQYDVVISDPSDIWVAGIGSLYTLEFYRAARARLRPGGLMVQWVHTHSTAPQDLALLVATFNAVFPHTQVWSPSVGDLILLGNVDALDWNYTRVAERIERLPGVRHDLQSIGIWHPAALFAAYTLGNDRLAGLIGEIKSPHVDDHPTLEFTTPRAQYVDTSEQIEALLAGLSNASFPPIVGFDATRHLDADATFLLGLAHASLEHPRRGLPYMERATQMAPERAHLFLGLGTQYRALGRQRDAEIAFGRALRIEPQNVDARIALGELQLASGAVEDALENAARILRNTPSDARAQDLAERARALRR